MKSIQLNSIRYSPADVDGLIADPLFAGQMVWQQKIFLFLQEWWSAGDTLVQHTSGSTGTPKEILLSKSSMVASAKRTCAYFQLGEDSRAVLCLSADYVAGKMMIVRALVSGMHLITVVPEGNPYGELTGSVDFIAMVPLQAENMFSVLGSAAEHMAEVKTVLLGGAAVSPLLEEKINAQDKTSFYLGYGMTETCSHVALRKLGADASPYYSAMDGVALSQDDRGCLVLEDPDLVEGRLVTNDLIEFVGENSTDFRWIGREDTIINSGGIKFSPEDLEEKISHLIPEPFLITSVADDRLGRKLILVIEHQKMEGSGVSLQSDRKKAVMESLAKVLSKYALPRELLWVSEIIKTANGKVDRRYDYRLLM